MRSLPRTVFVSIIGATTACSTAPHTQGTSKPAVTEPVAMEEMNQAISAIVNQPMGNEFEESDLEAAEPAVDAPVFEDGEDHTDDLASITSEIPIELNQQVKKWINYFTKQDSERFSRFVSRGLKYRKMIENILTEHGVPKELYYLAFIESGFASHATSHASAVGIWQFIRPTGVRYGLTVNNVLDERRDPVLATHAAAQYLGDLFRVYQSWYLAMASYNAGEARIMGAIMRSNTRDFWQLVHKRALPDETMNYIPKFIAAVIVGENLEKYGFSAQKDEDWTETAEIKVPAFLRLNDIARTVGVSVSELESLNPSLRRKHTVSTPRESNLRIWQKDLQKFSESTEKLAALPRSRAIESIAVAAAKSSADQTFYYRVKRGDSLRKIAQAHGVSIRDLKAMNQLRSSKIIRGQRLLISHASTKNYRVQRGDNLQKIADKFGMTVQQLKTINGMRRSVIYPGQRLTVADKKSRSDQL
jgi:membrane-bound lytic murein transglycosylase D